MYWLLNTGVNYLYFNCTWRIYRRIFKTKKNGYLLNLTIWLQTGELNPLKVEGHY